LRRETIPIDSWLAEVLDDQKIPDKIELVRTFDASDRTVSFDADRLRRVVINLVDNAAQAIEGGRDKGAGVPAEHHISVRTRLAADRVEIEVTDTGPGIPADVFPRIFEPLFS